MKRLCAYSFTLFLAFSLAASFVQAQEDVKPQAGKQVEMSFKTSDGAEVAYLLYLPKSYDAANEKKAPIMLFLHGRGESNGPLSLVAKWGPPKMAAAGNDLPYVMVSPQCPKEDYWNSTVQLDRLTELMDHVASNYVVDEKKTFLTGLSMGGYGSWALAAKHPTKFAAVAPICGGGKAEFAESLKDVPIWAWHGDQDGAVPFKDSVEMVDAIKEVGGTKVKFTSLEGHWPQLLVCCIRDSAALSVDDAAIEIEGRLLAIERRWIIRIDIGDRLWIDFDDFVGDLIGVFDCGSR